MGYTALIFSTSICTISTDRDEWVRNSNITTYYIFGYKL